jgi:aminoglycoside phosphotransferase (APT) family kinase protein
MHPDEIAVSADVVRELINAQFPRWRDLPVRRISSAGTVNAIFRIGDELAARLPLQPDNPDEVLATLEREALAATELAKHARIPTPRPIAIGTPGSGYPLPWSVQTWLPGTVATGADPGESAAVAAELADFIGGLRRADTQGARFIGTGRGGDLGSHDEWMETCFRRSEGLLDVPHLRAVWREWRDLPRVAPDVMSHGDLIPGNVLVAAGRLAGILDVGGFGPADPALDLIAGWHLLEDGPRAVFRDRLGSDDLEWARSKAWAFEQSMGAIWYYVDSNPTMSLMGRRTLKRVLEDSGQGHVPAGPPASG